MNRLLVLAAALLFADAQAETIPLAAFSDGIERRSGYAWFGTWPAALLNEEYPAWRLRHPR